MPLYQLRPLVENLPAIEAVEQQGRANAATVPYLEQDVRRQYMRALEQAARPLRPKEEPMRFEHIEHDPDKAAEWFEQMGFKVVHG